MILQEEKKDDAEGSGDPFHLVFPPAPENYFVCQSSEQNSLDDMYIGIYILR